uniref:Uncharacterized protein n=1 Tax=Anguilla anguilla TaxID=7936 RepID=A0A0E9U9A0_ANGAN
MLHPSIHPSIHHLYPLTLSRVAGGFWSLSQHAFGARGRNAPWTGRQSIAGQYHSIL